MTRGSSRALGKVLAGIAFVTMGAPISAVGQQAVEQCVALSDDVERLACYDSLFRDPSAPFEGAIVVESERLIPARPSGREPATMSLSCAEGGITVAFGFAGQFVSNTGDIAPLTYQVDAGGTTARTLRANAENTTLSFATPTDTEAFLESLVGGRNLKVRVTPVRQRSITVDFRLPDIADDIEALRATCG